VRFYRRYAVFGDRKRDTYSYTHIHTHTYAYTYTHLSKCIQVEVSNDTFKALQAALRTSTSEAIT